MCSIPFDDLHVDLIFNLKICPSVSWEFAPMCGGDPTPTEFPDAVWHAMDQSGSFRSAGRTKAALRQARSEAL